jgi:hypothetical protein
VARALTRAVPAVRLPAAALAVTLLVGVAGCGGGSGSSKDTSERVDTSDFAGRIQAELGRITGTVVDNVACPTGVRATPGTSFECGASFNGEADGVIVTVPRGSGQLQLRLRNLLLGKLETQIRTSLEKQKVPLAALDCAGPQPQRRGGEFVCTGEDRKGRRLRIAVEQVDDAGTVRFTVPGGA